jgi:hypothetical protein
LGGNYKVVNPLRAPGYKQVEGVQGQRIIGTYINWNQLGVEPQLIADNSARVKGRINYEDFRNSGPLTDEPVAIVGYGPSLKKTWPKLHEFKIIYSGSGSHRFLIDKGIVPTYHVESDPHEYKAEILGTPHPWVTYLISSICHPKYFDLLERHHVRVKLWHMLFMEPEIFQHFPAEEWIMTGGHIVGPRMVKIARIMGHGNLHIFGLDASTDGSLTHSDARHPNPPMELEHIEVNGRYYWTNRTWEDHANILFKELDRMPEVKTTFYGDGLIQAMAKTHVPVKRAPMPMMVFKGKDGQCYW